MITFGCIGLYAIGRFFFHSSICASQAEWSAAFTREDTVVSTSFTSATMPRETRTFLPIDAGSQSTCTIFAFFA